MLNVMLEQDMIENENILAIKFILLKSSSRK
jgi:hypothetical protein